MPRNMEGFQIEPTCWILESYIELVSEDLLGQVRSGYIKSKGDIARAQYQDGGFPLRQIF